MVALAFHVWEQKNKLNESEKRRYEWHIARCQDNHNILARKSIPDHFENISCLGGWPAPIGLYALIAKGWCIYPARVRVGIAGQEAASLLGLPDTKTARKQKKGTSKEKMAEKNATKQRLQEQRAAYAFLVSLLQGSWLQSFANFVATPLPGLT